MNVVEAIATARRIADLEGRPASGKLDAQHLRAIHRYIFQDVYSWAGEFRTVNIGKSGNLFALAEHIVSCLDQTVQSLRKERYLAGADPQRFCQRAAYYLGEINAIHPFREGNGRTQREFIRQLAARNGYGFRWSRVTRGQMIDASRQSFRRDYTGLEEILRSALERETQWE